MDFYIFLAVFILWYTFSVLISEKYGRKGRIGEEWSFFLCFMLSPVIGFLVTYFAGEKQPAAHSK